MKVQIEVSEKNEGTSEPWWILIDPSKIKSMLELAADGDEPSNDRIITAIAYSIEGPFFSREEGQSYLKRRAYEYSKDTIVWCSSGYWTTEYKNAIKAAK